ncbi:MAG TPA: NAD(P)/FAD-dependent oxidoreductase [Solirubrobacteraceae bacterium]|nr:NAD(P)/FAD-dependent oxidoreductase [Solirubrobacteraceae bacterium]
MSERIALLVIGGGPAGLAAARAYREANGAGVVAIITDEHRMPYQRPPLTKELLRGEADEGELPIEAETWLQEHRVRLVSGRAVSLDSNERTVALSGGRTLAYEQCLVATGAEPTRLPVPGADDPAVRVLRTIGDLRELNARLHRGTAVAVIGSGFIGCEIAASLRHRGHLVTMLTDEPAPNCRRLGAEAATRIAEWLGADGVKLHCGEAVDAIERADGTLTVSTGGARVRAGVVVMAAGVAPRGELAAAAGIATDGGVIPVDAGMRTDTEGVLAAGDVCRAYNVTAGRELRVEHWGDALGQGAVAGETAAGRPAAWGEVPGFWSTIGRRTLKYAAWGDGFDEARCVAHGDGFTVCYGRDGKLVGVLTHEADENYERGRESVAQGTPWRH